MNFMKSSAFVAKLHNICVRAFLNTNMKIHTTSVALNTDE